MTMQNSELERLSVKELRTLALNKGLARSAKLTREELLTALSSLPSSMPRSSTMAAAKGRTTAAPSRERKRATFTATSRPELSLASSSSSSTVARNEPTAPLAPPSTTENTGPALPTHYEQDRLVLMVQDPQHIFAYWEVKGHTLARIQADAGAMATSVLILHTEHGDEFRQVDLRGGNYYLAVAPDSSYEAELALRDAQGRLHPIARSNHVTTPAPSISPRLDEHWMGIDETFQELLQLAGLPGQVTPLSSAARLAEQRLNEWHREHGSLTASTLATGVSSSHLLSSHSLVRS
jgi:hypothetical protein